MSLPGLVSAQESDSTPSPSATNQADRATLEPASASVNITYPTAGETLTGSIPINIDTSLPGINRWELSFAFDENPTDTWFPLASGNEPFEGEILRWDTTPLTDGNYSLRLRAFFSEAYRDVLVSALKIRNYSADTPTPELNETELPSPSPTISPTVTVAAPNTAASTTVSRQTPTPLPPNPATLRNEEIAESALRGAGYSLLTFAVIGMLAWVKKKLMK